MSIPFHQRFILITFEADNDVEKVVTDKEFYEIITTGIPKNRNGRFEVTEIKVDMRPVIGVGGESIVVKVGAKKVIKIVQIRNEVDEDGDPINITVNAQTKKAERAATGRVQAKYVLKPLEFTIQCLKKNKTTAYIFGKYIIYIYIYIYCI